VELAGLRGLFVDCLQWQAGETTKVKKVMMMFDAYLTIM
jgi:hypothetical protein